MHLAVGVGLVMLFCTSPANAQDFRTDFQQIFSPFYGNASLNMEMEYRWFEGDAEEAKEVAQAQYSRVGGQVYSRLGHLEMIQEGEFTLTVDHQEKMVILQRLAEGQQSMMFGAPMADTLLQFYQGVQYDEPSPGLARYRFSFEGYPGYESGELWFRPATHQLARYVISLDQPGTGKARFEIHVNQIQQGNIPTSASQKAQISRFLATPYSEGRLRSSVSTYRFVYLNNQQ